MRLLLKSSAKRLCRPGDHKVDEVIVHEEVVRLDLGLRQHAGIQGLQGLGFTEP